MFQPPKDTTSAKMGALVEDFAAEGRTLSDAEKHRRQRELQIAQLCATAEVSVFFPS